MLVKAFRHDSLALPALACAVAAHAVVRVAGTYRALELGQGIFEVSVLVAASSAGAALLSIPIGRTIDRTGARASMLWGGLMLCIATLVSAVSTGLSLLAVSMSAVGVAHVCVMLGAQAMAAQGHSPRVRQQRFARNAVWVSVGQMAGPALAGVTIAAHWPMSGYASTGAFLAGAALGLLTVGLTLTKTMNRASKSAAPAEETAQLSVSAAFTLMFCSGMPAALTSGIALVLTADVLLAFFPLIGAAHGMSPTTVGTLLSLRAALALISRFAITALIAIAGTRRVLMTSMLASGSAAIVMVWSTDVWQFAVLMSILGAGIGVGAPLTAAWVAQLSPPALRATALGIRMSGNRAGQTVLPVTLGAIAAAAGSGVAIVLLLPGAALLVCATLITRAELGDEA